MKSKATIWIVLLVVGVFYLWRYRVTPSIDPAEIVVLNQDNQSQNLGQMLSDSAVIICYASWCGPCLRELRTLKSNWPKYANSGVQFYCISDDPQEKMDVMRSNMPSAITFLHINSLKDIGIYTIPATYFCLNRKVVDKQLEAIDWPNENIQTKFN